MSKNPVDPFQDTQDPFTDESPRHQAERIAERAQVERIAQGQDRRANDALVDRRLWALKDDVVSLRGEFGSLTSSVTSLAEVVKDMKAGQDKNNEMTEKMLGIVGGGKLLVSFIKFCGVMAVPITAIVTAIIAIRHGFS